MFSKSKFVFALLEINEEQKLVAVQWSTKNEYTILDTALFYSNTTL